MAQAKERETVLDVVCGTGVTPERAAATRVIEGRTYHFCCPGCAEAFDRNPAAYIQEEPIRAYKVEQKIKAGPDVEQVKQAEARAQELSSGISAAEQRAKAAREKLDRLQRDLEDARARFAARRDEMLKLGRREEELRAMPEAKEVSELDAQVTRERGEFDAAQRALGEARSRQRASLIQQRAEVSDMEGREKMLQEEIKAEQARAADLEARMAEMEKLRPEWEDARARLAQRREELATLARQEEAARAAPAPPETQELDRRIEENQAAVKDTERTLAAARQRQRDLAGTPEAARAKDYEEQIARARVDFEQAQRQLGEAHMKVEAIKATQPPSLTDLEMRRKGVEADLQAQEVRVRDLEVRVTQIDKLRAELDEARAKLDKDRADMEALGHRDEEIRAALSADDQRIAGLERQVIRERTELEEAQRALAGAQVRTREMLRARRTELAELERRRKAGGLGRDEKRIKDLEARITALEDEAGKSEKRSAELRDAQKRAEDEVNRIRTETREVTLEGMPAVTGEEPGELFAIQHRSHGRQGTGSREKQQR